MNRMHRTVWSEARQCHVVTSEKTAARGKPASTRNAAAIAVAALMLHVAPALATPVCTPSISTAMTATCIVSTNGDQTVTSTGSIITADGNGIMTVPVSGMGSIVNQGTIDAQGNGIMVQLSSLSGSISNSGTIHGGANGISVDSAQVAGGIHNAASGLIHGGIGIALNSPDFGNIVNEGSISGTIFGLQVQSGQGNRIVNSGTIEGSLSSLTALPTAQLLIDIEGTHARFIGDVFATNSDVTVKSGAAFSNDSGFAVKNFTVENGASFTLRPVASSMMNPGMSGGIHASNGFTNAGVVAASIVTEADGPVLMPNIVGNYTQTSTGVLRVNVASDTSYGQLQVYGSATLPSYALIDVNVTTPGYVFTADKLVNVLSATTLNSDGTFRVSDNSLLFDFGAVRNGNAIDLTIAPAGNPGQPGSNTVLGSVNARGNSPATGAARVLDQVIGSAPGGKLAGKFVGLTTQQQVSDAVTQTLPLLNGASTVAAGSALSG
ncbi:MAG: ESPR-type extended signal peptide-containing protein, partial [Microvirgula sp.]